MFHIMYHAHKSIEIFKINKFITYIIKNYNSFTNVSVLNNVSCHKDKFNNQYKRRIKMIAEKKSNLF